MQKNSCLFAMAAIIFLYWSQAQAKEWWCNEGTDVPLVVTAHLQNAGDKKALQNQWTQHYANTAIQNFIIAFQGKPFAVKGLSIKYMCHRGNGQGGDTGWVKEGAVCGVINNSSAQLEGFAVKLAGPMARYFTLDYGCHIASKGNSGPAPDGDRYCGTRGMSLAIESMMVSIKSKGNCPRR